MKDKILKNKKVIIPVISILLILVIVGVSFAYFSATVNKVNETESNLNTKKLGLIFNGTKEINYQNMIPGDSFEKKFTVENTSSQAVTFNVYLQNITNQYNEDLVYTLKDENNTELITESKLPNTNTGKNYLKTGIEIAANSTVEYTLTIEYKYLIDQPQNDYQGKVFNATLGIDTNQNAIANSDLTLSTKSINANDITDGGSVTRTFTVTNTTDETQLYNVKLVDVVNTYANGVTYTLSKNNTEVVASTALPSSDTTILTNQVIASGATDTYTLTISYDSTQAMIEGFMLLSNGTNEFSASIRTESRIAGVEKTIGEKLDLSTIEEDSSDTITITATNYAASAKTFNLNLNEIAENFTTKVTYKVKKNDVIISSSEATTANTIILENESVSVNTTNTYEIEILKPAFTCLGDNCPTCIRGKSLHTNVKGKTTTTFGSLGTKGEDPVAGNVFDCDVNGDGIYDKDTERFYYVSHAIRNGVTSDSVAVLIASTNYYDGTVDLVSTTAYTNVSQASTTGPIVAKDHLPTTTDWKNVHLELGTTRNICSSAGSRCIDFSYEGYAARLLSLSEVYLASCTDLDLSSCPWFLENTSTYSTYDGDWWLETYSSNGYYPFIAEGWRHKMIDVGPTGLHAIRPAIEVNLSDIDY